MDERPVGNLDERDRQLMLMLVWLFLQHGRDDKALALCRELAADFPGDGVCGGVHAMLLLRDGRPREALAALDGCSGTEFSRSRVYALQRARALLESGDEDAARRAWRDYLAGREGRGLEHE